MNRNICFRLLRSTLAAIPVLMLGCGSGVSQYNSSVEGVVTLDDLPLGNVVVSFVPNSQSEGQLPISTALTDEQGRFKLQFKRNGQTDEPGASLGAHLVLVKDQMTERKPRSSDSDTKGPVESKKKVPSRYGFPTTTPLTVEVTSDRHDYPLSLKSR
jgi:hypothetical protein